MKKRNRFISATRLLIVSVLAIMAFARGQWQLRLLAAAFIMWSAYMLFTLLHKKTGVKKTVCKPLTVKKQRVPVAPEVPDSPEQTLLRHVNCRITERLKPFFPEANWEWACEEKPVRLAADGETGRIRIFDAKGYNYVDVVFDRLGRIDFNMVRIVPLEQALETADEHDSVAAQDVSAVDAGVWYDIVGRTVLNNLITELNSQGHNKLYIRENGEMFVQREGMEVRQDALDNLPAKQHWPALVSLFMKDGLTASSGNDCIALSW